jgi:ribosomal protein S18 acetylase RimI-like enzyme
MKNKMIKVQEISKDERFDEFLLLHWGSEFIVSGDERLYGHDLDGFTVFDGEEIVGLLLYHLSHSECEIVFLKSLRPGQGIGSALLDKMAEKAGTIDGLKRLWLMTTNDNILAQDFYKKRGFFVSAIHKGAIQKSRDLGEKIPMVAENGIPICDEVEMEYLPK